MPAGSSKYLQVRGFHNPAGVAWPKEARPKPTYKRTANYAVRNARIARRIVPWLRHATAEDTENDVLLCLAARAPITEMYTSA